MLKGAPCLRIAVVHNRVSADGAPDELDVLSQADAVSEALIQCDHKPIRLACDLNLAGTRNALLAIKPHLVFNLVESLEGQARLIHVFPSLLETMALPYSGACAEALLLTTNKLLAKAWMDRAGLPTPVWTALDSAFRPEPASRTEAKASSHRWIIKSVWEHASIGLDDDAVVEALPFDQLNRLLHARSSATGGPYFAEAFIEGREFNLSLLKYKDEVIVLPPAEMLFQDFDESRPKIVGYQAKWEQDSFQYCHTKRCYDFAPDDDGLLEKLRQLSLDCWRLFGLNGYARVDFRVDLDNQPWILEVNANPCLSTDAGFAAAIRRSHLNYAQAIQAIIEDCRQKPRLSS